MNMPKKALGRRRTGIVLGLCAMLTLAGCGTGQSGKTASESDSAPETSTGSSQKPSEPGQDKKPVITFLNMNFAETTPKDDENGLKVLEDVTGYDLKINWVPSNAYNERVNVTLASGEMPNVIRIGVNNPTIVQMIRSDAIWEITPYLDEFPNLATYHPIIMEGAKVDGKMYAIPRPSAVSPFGTVIREDWLAKVGMEAPKTLDELYELMKAFKEKDPDGNGVDDTYGMMMYEGRLESPIFAAKGAPNGWKVENGQFIKAEETPEYLEALKWFRKVYEEGLVNANFPVAPRNEVRNDLYNGKVGMSLEWVYALPPFYVTNFKNIGKDVLFTAGPPLNGRAFGSMPYDGFIIPKQGVKTEEELKKVLAYFNKLRSPEGEQAVYDYLLSIANTSVPIGDIQEMNVNDIYMYAKPGSPNEKIMNQRVAENADVAVLNPAEGLISPTDLEKGTQLSTILKDASIQFVVGEIDEAGFQAAVEKWKSTGGSKVAKEFAELYQK